MILRMGFWTWTARIFFTNGTIPCAATVGSSASNHISWWQDELPSDEEYVEARQTLERLDWKTDYIITHCAPTAIQQKISPDFKPDKLTDFLGKNPHAYSRFHYWLFGHYHDTQLSTKSTSCFTSKW